MDCQKFINFCETNYFTKEFCKIILIKIIKYNKINKKYIKYSFNFFLMLKLVTYEYNEYKFQKLFKIE